MEDNEIVALFMKRDEKAITETKLKYGKYIFSISYNILRQKEDAEECVNDTYLAAWNCIPPNEPTSLAPF